MKDFTLAIYELLIKELIKKYKVFITFKEHCSESSHSNGYVRHEICILRHDVDLLPINSLTVAKIEKELGIRGTYFFRIIPESFNLEIIEKIAFLGHEIGYHYEDVDLVLKSQKSKVKISNGAMDGEKLIDLAYESFCKNLDTFRKNFEIKTICMHGSPLSRYDNKLIWKKYNYKDLGLIGEPYFDIDWNEFGYLTDTGRRWNAFNSSVRDKVNSKFNFNFKSTQEIFRNIGSFPDKLMVTVHPQRWNAKLFPWLEEYLSQNLKNIVKKYFLVGRNLIH